jgi:hypothetical protein
MAHSIKKVEFGNNEGLDKHDRRSSNDSKQADDIHDAEYVQDNVTWASQGAFPESHF